MPASFGLPETLIFASLFYNDYDTKPTAERRSGIQPTHNVQLDWADCAERPKAFSGMSSITTMNERRTGRHRSHRTGLRTVAFVEALKGVLALVAAYVLIRLIRRDVDFGEAAEHILYFFHISTHHRISQQFLNAADKMSDTSIATILALAGPYALLRFIEGYGLWRQRVWAEWLAIVSGCLYIPFEVWKLIRHPNQLHVVILTVNILVVLYIGWVRWDEIKAARAAMSIPT
jgi:uncharacterized membrane protein (DUF2068 family)